MGGGRRWGPAGVSLQPLLYGLLTFTGSCAASRSSLTGFIPHCAAGASRCAVQPRRAPHGRLFGSLPPDDSPYAKPEEELPFWGDDYVPKEGHPGTMPPGTRLEDKPMEELPPVSNIPYPHFQEWPFHYRFPAYQPRRLNFIEWMTEQGIMVEDDGDSRSVLFLGRKRRLKSQMDANIGAQEALEEERRAILDTEGDYWTQDELVGTEQFIFDRAKTKRGRVPYIVKLREAKAKEKAEAEAAKTAEI